MRYISIVDFKKQVTTLLMELRKTNDPKEQQKIQEEIAYLKKVRLESEVEEKLRAMQERRR